MITSCMCQQPTNNCILITLTHYSKVLQHILAAADICHSQSSKTDKLTQDKFIMDQELLDDAAYALCRHFISTHHGVALFCIKWHHAIIWKLWCQIENPTPSIDQSTHIWLRYQIRLRLPNFIPIQSETMTGSGFFKDSCLNNNKNKMSNDTRSVPNEKYARLLI